MADKLEIDSSIFADALCAVDPAAPRLEYRDALAFTNQVFKTLNTCTAANVKTCKTFILSHITPSQPRTDALAQFLVQLSQYFEPADTKKQPTTASGPERNGLHPNQRSPNPSFARLHILYIVNDVLCFLYSHASERNGRLARHFTSIEENLLDQIPALAILAAHGNRLAEVTRVLDHWRKLSLFSPDYLARLEAALEDTRQCDWETLQGKATAHPIFIREKPPVWTIPQRHGHPDDPEAEWHDLPAGNGLYQKRTQGFPLQSYALPPGGYPLREAGREADDLLKNDVEMMYRDVLDCFEDHKDVDEVNVIDEMGNIEWHDPTKPTRTHWGFTVEGIKKRKAEQAADR